MRVEIGSGGKDGSVMRRQEDNTDTKMKEAETEESGKKRVRSEKTKSVSETGDNDAE